jgi:hypothetical protein
MKARARISVRVLFYRSQEVIVTKTTASGHFYLKYVTKYLTE